MKCCEALRILAEISEGQFGLVTAAQAEARGVYRSVQSWLCREKLLEELGTDVYRVVGAPEPSHVDCWVAWLQLDPARQAWERNGLGPDDGVISHRTACLLHGIGDIPAPHTELTVPRKRTAIEFAVRLHVGELKSEDITIVDGLPVTTVEKTIVDLLASGADGGHIGGVIADAEWRNLFDFESLANRVTEFAESYARSNCSGEQLLSILVWNAGQQLVREDIRQFTRAAELAGILEGYELAHRENREDDIVRSHIPAAVNKLIRRQANFSFFDSDAAARLQKVINGIPQIELEELEGMWR